MLARSPTAVDAQPDTASRCHKAGLRRASAIGIIVGSVLLLSLGLATGATDVVAGGLVKRQSSGSTGNGSSPWNNLYLIAIIVGIFACVVLAVLISACCCREAFRNPCCCPCYLCGCLGCLSLLECVGCGLCFEGLSEV